MSGVRRWMGRIVLALVLLSIGWLAYAGVRSVHYARQALADLERIEATVATRSASGLPVLLEDVSRLQQHLEGVRSAARPFLWLGPRLYWVPGYGAELAAAPALLDTAIELAAAGREALAALSPAAESLGEPIGRPLSGVLEALRAAEPGLAAAGVRLDAAVERRAAIGGPLHPRIQTLLDVLDRGLPLARVSLVAARATPAPPGGDGGRTPPTLAQNNHELRGAGGFISGVGSVRLVDGRITELRLVDSYAVDNLDQPHPTPPVALAEQMGADILLLRDSNWSPDFPESAAVARAIFQQDQGVATDGAIAVDLEAVRLLVAALGGLQVPGIDEPVTGANAIEWMKRAWQAPLTTGATVAEATTSDWWLRRKDFMGELVAAALARVERGSDLDVTALAQSLLAMLEGRHLQVAVDDPVLAPLLGELGWDGGLRPPAEGDFLAVIDSNVGFNKANAAVVQDLTYRLEPADQGWEAVVTLRYRHTAPAAAEQVCERPAPYGASYDDLVNRCYWDYLRVYVRGGSTLLSGEGLRGLSSEPGERGATVFSGDFVLRPGQEHTVSLRYRLAPQLATAPYHLLVRKQAGTMAPSLSVEAGPCRWDGDLSRDRIFDCADLAPDTP